MARQSSRHVPYGAQRELDKHLSSNEEAIRKAASAASRGERRNHPEPRHPNAAERSYLNAIELFRRGRQVAGWAAYERGDYFVLLRGARHNRRTRSGRDDRRGKDRKTLIRAIYLSCPRDYRLRGAHGEHKVMTLEHGTTTLVTLENLSDARLDSMYSRFVRG